MATVDNIAPDDLSKAVAIWTGYDSASSPTRDDNSIARAFPAQNTADLLQVVKALEDDFFRSNAHETAPSLAEMGNLAASEFRRLYPNLPTEISDRRIRLAVYM